LAPPPLGAGSLAHGDIGTATALIAFGGHDLIIMSTKLQALAFPIFNMVAKVDRSGYTAGVVLRISDTDILVKALRSVDRGRVITSALMNLITGATASKAALVSAPTTRGRVIRPVTLDHIILDQRVRRPAVKRQIRVDITDGIIARIGDSPRTAARVPALAAHPVVCAGGPIGGVPAARLQGECSAPVVLPE